jgi:hypothetical protein
VATFTFLRHIGLGFTVYKFYFLFLIEFLLKLMLNKILASIKVHMSYQETRLHIRDITRL